MKQDNKEISVAYSPTKKFTCDGKALVIYGKDRVLMLDEASLTGGKLIEPVDYCILRMEYKEMFKSEFPSLDRWQDSNGSDKLSDYINIPKEEDNYTFIDHPGYGKQIVRYKSIEISSKQLEQCLNNINETLTKIQEQNKPKIVEEEKQEYKELQPYTADDFDRDIYGTAKFNTDILPLMEDDESILVFRGSVGTGKSTIAQRVGWVLTGYKNSDRMEIVNFNPSTEYDTLYIGVEPVPNMPGAFRQKPGIIKKICDRAILDPENRYVLFIDEFNRGDFNRIGGPLLSCLADRNLSVKLDSSNILRIPKNVQVIITMNTSDKSLTSLDRAVVDRMVPIDINSKEYRDKFKITVEELTNNEDFNDKEKSELNFIISLIDTLNSELDKDSLLGCDSRISNRPIMHYAKTRNLKVALSRIKITLDYLLGNIENSIHTKVVEEFNRQIATLEEN